MRCELEAATTNSTPLIFGLGALQEEPRIVSCQFKRKGSSKKAKKNLLGSLLAARADLDESLHSEGFPTCVPVRRGRCFPRGSSLEELLFSKIGPGCENDV